MAYSDSDVFGASGINLVVHDRRFVADGVVELTLRRPDGDEQPLPGWEPGAHIDLHLSGDMVRQYSLHGDPRDHCEWKISVLREAEGRGGSKFIHDQLRKGSAVRVTGLRNKFKFVDSTHYVFVAGGIGITPLLPMLQAAEAAGADWKLYYGGRARSSMAHVDRVSEFADRATIWPQDERGLLDLASICEDNGKTALYCCGPEPLLKAVEEACAHWPPDRVRMERFVAPDADDVGELVAFEVELSKSGITLQIPADRSIMDVATEAGVKVPRSCTEGLCGSCETEVLEGVPLHRDSVLTAEERDSNETMMVCVSRARTPRLVLEL